MKKSIFTVGAILLIAVAACTKKDKDNPNDLNPSGCYQIGDTLAGGIVFYLDETKCHGLVCAFEDQAIQVKYATLNWKDFPLPNGWEWGSTPYTNLSNEAIGMGQPNTNTIISNIGSTGNVAVICKNYTGGGYSDWFLPSLKELVEIYTHKDKIPGLGWLYWSSTAGGYSNSPCLAAGIIFWDGSEFWSVYDEVPGDLLPNVRAVRKF